MSTSSQLIYHLPLTGVQLTFVQWADIIVQVRDGQIPTTNGTDGADHSISCTVNAEFHCTACHCQFDTAEQQRQHSKSAYHIHNVKLKQQNHAPVTESQYNAATQRASNAADSSDSAVSGMSAYDIPSSDESMQDEESVEHEHSQQNAPTVQFIDTKHHIQYTVWRAVLVSGADITQNVRADAALYLARFRSLCTATRHTVTVLMSMGGRFSGAVCQYTAQTSAAERQPTVQCIHHKSFQRYTTRRKQGGAQFTQDASGKYASSVGATIRRAETKKYIEQIHTTLASWQTGIAESDIIFVFAPSYNKNILFAPQSILQRTDPRIRSIPLPARRPTFAEVQRIYNILTSVNISPHNDNSEEFDVSHHTKQPEPPMHNVPSTDTSPHTTAPPAVREDQLLNAIVASDADRVRDLYIHHYARPVPVTMPALYYAVKCHRVDMVDLLIDLTLSHHDTDSTDSSDQLISRTGIDVDVDIDECTTVQHSADVSVDSLMWTPLHRACYDARDDVVRKLLHAGANPLLTDVYNRNAYELCREKSTRTVIRLYAGEHPDRYHWSSAGIVPLSDAVDAAQRQKAAEQRRAKKARQKEKLRLERAAAAALQAEQAQQAAQAQAQQQATQARVAAEKQRTAELKQIQQTRDAAERSMSDRERRALAVERRLAAQSGKQTGPQCTVCGTPITSVPYKRGEYVYDTIQCVEQHMIQQST